MSNAPSIDLVNPWPKFCQIDTLITKQGIENIAGDQGEPVETGFKFRQVANALLELGLYDTLSLPDSVQVPERHHTEHAQVFSRTTTLETCRQFRWDDESGNRDNGIKTEPGFACNVGIIMPRIWLDDENLVHTVDHVVSLAANSGKAMPTIDSKVSITAELDSENDTHQEIITMSPGVFSVKATLGFLTLIREMTATVEH